jgi:hypothetical protein
MTGKQIETIPTAAETAANVVNQAAETAKNVVAQAAVTATNVLSSEATITKALSDALREVFGENVQSGRFIDVTRVPLICQSIVTIHADIKDIKEKLDKQYVTKEVFNPVRAIAFGLVSAVALAVLAKVLDLI